MCVYYVYIYIYIYTYPYMWPTDYTVNCTQSNYDYCHKAVIRITITV